MKPYTELEEEVGIKDVLMQQDYLHAVRLCQEDFELIRREVQGWQPDMAEHHMLKQMHMMEEVHEVVEQALKILLKIRGTFIDKPQQKRSDKHHNLLPLFEKLPDLDKTIVRQQFDVYVSLYDRLASMSLEDYLDKWGKSEQYIKNRYAPAEAIGKSAETFAKDYPEMHPWVLCEIAYALVDILIAKAFSYHRRNTIDRRLDSALQRIILRDSYMKLIKAIPPEAWKSPQERMISFVAAKGGWMNTAVFLIRMDEIEHENECFRSWLRFSKVLLQSDTTGRPFNLDMKMFIARAEREELRWSAEQRRFFTEGSKYEAYRVFDDDKPYVLRWRQGNVYGEITLHSNEVPDWRSHPQPGEQINILGVAAGARRFDESISLEEATDFVLVQGDVEKMQFTALILDIDCISSTLGEKLDMHGTEELNVYLVVCDHGDTYRELPWGKEHEKLPYSWIEYKKVLDRS